MIFTPTTLAGSFIIDVERFHDERGYFARSFSRREFVAHGLPDTVVECNISWNIARGTLRGMHFQEAPFAQAKLVRCTRGAVYDVLLDLRQGSPTFLRWVAVELSAETQRAVFIPDGFAHGFQTLTDEAEVFYQMFAPHEPAAGRGVRWNDPAFGIEWPITPPTVIARRDAEYPDFPG